MNKIKELVKMPAFWVILVLFLIGCIALTVLKKDKKEGYLLLSNISSYRCDKKECKSIEKEKINEKDSIDNFTVFESFNHRGNYKIKYINKWNFFDNYNNWVNISENFIAGSKSLDLKVQNFNIRKLNTEELTILEKYLKENNIDFYSNLEQNEVLEYDFNKNGKNEKILLASNLNDETKDEKLFSIVISVINNKSSIIHLDIYNKNENYQVPTYKIKGIINIFNQKEDFLILLKGYFSNVGVPTTYIYNCDKNNMQSIVKGIN